MDLRPFGEVPRLDFLLERLGGGEMVMDPVDFRRAPGSGGGGNRFGDPRESVENHATERGLAPSTRSGQNDEPGGFGCRLVRRQIPLPPVPLGPDRSKGGPHGYDPEAYGGRGRKERRGSNQ